MKRKIPQFSYHSNFSNPFAERKFIYGDREYIIPTEHDGVLLYLYIYGLAPKSLWKLFKIPTQYGHTEELPIRNLPKIISQLARYKGCEHTHEFATFLDLMVQEAINKNIIIDRHDVSCYEFSRWNKDVFRPWLQEFILRNFPNIIKDLAKTFPNIKIFY